MTLPFVQSCNDCGAIVSDTDVCPQCGTIMPR